MNVILTGTLFAKPRTFSLRRPLHALVLLGFLSCCFSLVAVVSYYSGFYQAVSPEEAKLALIKIEAEISLQRDELMSAEQRSEIHMNSLALRLGELHAQTMRLNALGQMLTEVGNLDSTEFNFDDIPALGGPGEGVMQSALEPQAFSSAILTVATRLEDQERQLLVLEDLLLDRALDVRLLPAGRPVKAGWISSGFGKRIDPFSGAPSWHAGVDFSGRTGDDVYAVADGIVIWSGKRYGFGNMIEIDHGNGFVTRYAHNSELTVKVSDKISSGELIAKVGSSGRSSAPHLHFEVLKDDKSVNPIKYIKSKS